MIAIIGKEILLLVLFFYCIYLIYAIITAIQWHFKYRMFLDNNTMDDNLKIWIHDPKTGNFVLSMGIISIGTIWISYSAFPIFFAVFIIIGFLATGYKYALSPVVKNFRYNPELAKQHLGEKRDNKFREIKIEINDTLEYLEVKKWYRIPFAGITVYLTYLFIFDPHNVENGKPYSLLGFFEYIGVALLSSALLIVIFYFILRLISRLINDSSEVLSFHIPEVKKERYKSNQERKPYGARPTGSCNNKQEKQKSSPPPPQDDDFSFNEEKFKKDRFSDNRFDDKRAKNKYEGRFKAAHDPNTPENEAFQSLKWIRQADEGKQKGIKAWSDKN